ncbi:hypothetical protein [Coxiella-like endosymbiont of Rhipicephalus sanguineus]|nr:hypothetical protein [Coxiella-like endosymbiont of Rhipicephalus sanguineus]
MINAVPVYSIQAYQIALTIIPILFLLAFIIGGFVIKETYCTKQYQD